MHLLLHTTAKGNLQRCLCKVFAERMQTPKTDTTVRATFIQHNNINDVTFKAVLTVTK